MPWPASGCTGIQPWRSRAPDAGRWAGTLEAAGAAMRAVGTVVMVVVGAAVVMAVMIVVMVAVMIVVV